MHKGIPHPPELEPATQAFIDGLPADKPIHTLSPVDARAVLSTVQKAATVGISVLAAISAPTALAIQLADATGLTLIGFARSESHVVYTRPRRVAGACPENAS